MDDDDWLVASLTAYHALNVYDLPQPVAALDWVTNREILCVGCTPDDVQSEIYLLDLPGKLFNDSTVYTCTSKT